MPLFLKYFLLLFALSAASSSISACEKTAKSKKCMDKAYSQERYTVSRNFARANLQQRILKWSRCMRKVSIGDHIEKNLMTIRKNLSKDGNRRLSRDIVVMKKQLHINIKNTIDENDKIDKGIYRICRTLESDFRIDIDKAYDAYFKFPGIKR